MPKNMANDHHHHQDRRHGSSVSANDPHDQSHGHYRSSSNSKQGRKHPSSGFLQVRRPASSQRAPASHPAPRPRPQGQATNDAPAPAPAPAPAAAEPAPVPTADPEAMPAKQGLNEWGAFGGGTPAGPGAAGGGTFGFGPLLFHAGGEQAGDEVDAFSNPAEAARRGWTTRETDAFEMDRLLQNDPISFNPLQAISWAKLDDEPMDERIPDPAFAQRTGSRVPSPPTGRGSTVGDKSRHGSREQPGRHSSKHTSSATQNVQKRNKTQVSHAVSRGSDHTEPSASPVGTMSKTFSAVTLQTPDMADGRSTFVPPPAPRVASSHPSPTAGPNQQLLLHGPGGQYGQRQQRKHRHRSGTKSSPHPGPSPVQTEVYHQQQALRPPPTLPPSALPLSMAPQPGFALSQQACPYSSYQVGPAPYATAPAADHIPPTLPPQQDLFLCLGPYCSARFPTEAELNAHYRAEHSLACNWASCGAAGFTSNNALVWHVKAEHLLLCPMPGCCDRVFASKKALDGHVRVS